MSSRLQLCTLDPEMAVAWRTAFAAHAAVSVKVGDILKERADAIVSPANSFGFMDGGIDLAYSHHFGWELEERLKSTIRDAHAGELPIGDAVVISTEHTGIPFLVSAPTMRIPAVIANTVNVYLAFRAALLSVQAHNRRNRKRIASVLCPALGAGIGGMPPPRVARQMHAAYSEVELGDTAWRSSARSILKHHHWLLE